MRAQLTDFAGLRGVALVVALTEATKRLFPALAPRFFVAVAMGWALLLNLGIAWYYALDPFPWLVEGLTVGLAAIGLYSGAKNVVGTGNPSNSASDRTGTVGGMQDDSQPRSTALG